MLQREGIAQ